ncbi:MAG: hypothetical protein ACRYG2_18725, partial [Janthinobacterium lividum]
MNRADRSVLVVGSRESAQLVLRHTPDLDPPGRHHVTTTARSTPMMDKLMISLFLLQHTFTDKVRTRREAG